MEAALEDGRAGERPLTVRAVRATGRPGELVLSATDADRVLRLVRTGGGLSRGCLIIVMD
jgi:hypothetical protein